MTIRTFTDSAKKAMGLARQEALQLHHDALEAEHILFGLVAERSGAAARFLSSCGVNFEGLHAELIAALPARTTTPGLMPFSPSARRVIERALEEAESFDHEVVGTAHLLLGLVTVSHGEAARLLATKGIDLAKTHSMAEIDEGSECWG